MNNITNNQQACDVICKKSCRIQSHERDLYRVCPSKLSKRELENLYFALLDNNRELKKTLHSQQDRLKVLSTKVQRMTVAQRNAAGKEKDCCSSKVLCKEQKEIIADLKTANDQMSERIRLLNMRLCSAKQFLKRSPFQTIKCPRCGICNVAIKNSSATLDAKPSRENVRMSSASCQYIPAETSEALKVTQDAETETDKCLNDGAEKQCNENKCRTVMDELKQKILNLQEELSNSHDEYSKRISKLETDVSGLRQENTQVRSGKAASDHALERGERRADDLRGRLRDAEGRVNDLTMQLSIEKHKVKELETSLKLATASSPVAKIIETINTPKAKSSSYVEASGSMSSYYSVKQDTVSPRKCKSDLLSPTSTRLSPTKQKDDAKFSKSDDSGYTDLNKSSEADDTKTSYMERLNQEMLKKISDLQMQVDGFRIKAAGETVKPETQKSSETGTSDYETQMAVITIAEPETFIENRKLDVEIRDLKGDTKATTSTPIKESDVVSNSSKLSKSEYEAKPWNDLVRDMDSDLNKTEENSDKNKPASINKTVNESKRDDDNKYQIPGPIPTTSYQSSRDKRVLSKNRSTSKDKPKNNNDSRQRKKSIEEKDLKINDSSENYRSEHKSSEAQAKNDKKSDAVKATPRTESPTKNIEPPKVQTQKLKIVEPKDVNVGNANDSKVNYPKVQNITEDKTVPCADTVGPANDYTFDSFATLINENNANEAEPVKEMGVQSETKQDAVLEQPTIPSRVTQKVEPTKQQYTERTATQTVQAEDTKVQTAPQSDVRRDSATYTEMPLRRDSATYTAMPPHRDSATYTAMPPRRESATYTKPECVCERATSPENTERDVSSLSDLPPEKDVKSPPVTPPTSPRDARSPGEEKATSTYTDTDTRTYDYGALSDGELPTHATYNRPRRFSFGEKLSYAKPLSLPQRNSEAQMEATLNAISEELAHCRKLLAAARDHERPSVSYAPDSAEVAESSRPGGRERVHRLHAAAGARRLPRTDTCAAVFTLHVGTLVLSDEAVLSSRDKSLILTWQFYDQALAMTRMRAGRVVLFDFSTEYDVTFNDDFLEYMKQNEMPLTICDINNQNEPFATCSLPLRDALINANRRVDVSLALTAGPAFVEWGARARGADALVAGDELGVLDLWCCLRAPPRLRGADARSLVDPVSEAAGPAASSSDLQLADEDPDSRISQEMLLSSTAAAPAPYRPDPKFQTKPGSDRPTVAPEHDWSYSQQRPSILQHRDSKGPFINDRSYQPLSTSVQTQKSLHRSDHQPDARWPNTRRRSSLFTDAEVPTNIRSTVEMKQALEKNVHTEAGPQKNEDDLSQARSSLGSLRNAADKYHQKTRKHVLSRVPEGLQQMLKEERKMSMVAAATAKENSARKKQVPFTKNSQDNEQTVENKYNNIGQYLGLNKILEQSKKTVTYTDADPSPVKELLISQGQENSAETQPDQSIDITVLWLALNEECEAMDNPQVHRLYVAYSFLGRRGADLETPNSLPKPKHYAEKCYFNFKKTFNLHDSDLPLLGHMSRCRAGRAAADPRDCIVFSVVSEPPEDPLGLSSCEDVGHAYLYLGDILAYSAGGAGYTEVVPVRAARRGAGGVCGVLAVRLDGLHVLRRCLTLSHSVRDLQNPALP